MHGGWRGHLHEGSRAGTQGAALVLHPSAREAVCLSSVWLIRASLK